MAAPATAQTVPSHWKEALEEEPPMHLKHGSVEVATQG
jgi:hypothetical protein